ncbi:MAG: transcriptional repressor [Labilithrix sp.]|nr:transcriptional repressor [Labilithrix sp.]
MATTKAKTRKKTAARARGARATEEVLRDRLREAGLKATAGRLSVLAELRRAKAPASHAEVAARLAGAQLDKVTVWRILVALTGAGLVDRTDIGDHTWRFELRDTAMGHDPHPHFMCVACKAVQCLPRDAVHIAPRIGRGVIDVQIKGRCERCL